MRIAGTGVTRRYWISFSWTITSRRSWRLPCGVAVAMSSCAQVLAVPDLDQRYRRRYHLCFSCCPRRGDFCTLSHSTPLDQYYHGHIHSFNCRYRPRPRTWQEWLPPFSASSCMILSQSIYQILVILVIHFRGPDILGIWSSRLSCSTLSYSPKSSTRSTPGPWQPP